MDKMNEIDNLKYDRIWLTDELGEVNWCQHKITNNDVEYANRNAVIDECIEVLNGEILLDIMPPNETKRKYGIRLLEEVENKLERLKDKEQTNDREREKTGGGKQMAAGAH